MNSNRIVIPFGKRNILVTLDEDDADSPVTLEIEAHPDCVGDKAFEVGLSRKEAIAVGKALRTMARDIWHKSRETKALMA